MLLRYSFSAFQNRFSSDQTTFGVHRLEDLFTQQRNVQETSRRLVISSSKRTRSTTHDITFISAYLDSFWLLKSAEKHALTVIKAIGFLLILLFIDSVL